jgi:hypothetical protein
MERSCETHVREEKVLTGKREGKISLRITRSCRQDVRYSILVFMSRNVKSRRRNLRPINKLNCSGK